MARNKKYPRPQGPVNSYGLGILLSLFAVVVLAVSAIALKGSATREGAGFPTVASAPVSTPSIEETNAPVEEPSAEPTVEVVEEPEEPEEPSQVEIVPPTRILATVDRDLLIRATAASCDSVTAVEFSQDGGETWVDSSAIQDTASTQALRIIPTRAGLIQLVALNEECEPQLVRTENLGDTWTAPINASGAWYLDPAQPNELGGPDGALEIDCEAVHLAATADRAAVLCSDSTIITSSDRGQTWSEPVEAPDVTSVGLSDDGYVVSLGYAGECAGIQVASFDGNDFGPPGACLEREVSPGDTVVVQTADIVFAWSGEDFMVSLDSGESWS